MPVSLSSFNSNYFPTQHVREAISIVSCWEMLLQGKGKRIDIQESHYQCALSHFTLKRNFPILSYSMLHVPADEHQQLLYSESDHQFIQLNSLYSDWQQLSALKCLRASGTWTPDNALGPPAWKACAPVKTFSKLEGRHVVFDSEVKIVLWQLRFFSTVHSVWEKRYNFAREKSMRSLSADCCLPTERQITQLNTELYQAATHLI